MSYVQEYLSASSSIKHVTVDFELEGVATKKDLESITHVNASDFALKTNLSALKAEVDKLDIPKLGTIPTNVAKLTNKVANDLVEKTGFSLLKTKVDKNETDDDNLETKVDKNHLIAESSINNVKTKVDGDLAKYVLKSDYDTKAGNLELKIPDVSGKLNTSDFDSKVSELENEIKTAESKPDISNLASKTEVKNVENKIPNVNGFVIKTDYANEITSIKNDYVSNAALTSQLNDSESTYIPDEVKKVDDKTKKNSTGILKTKTSLEHSKSVINDLEREASFNRGFYYYTQESYFLFEPRSKSFSRNGGIVNSWISTGIHNERKNTDLFSVNNSNNNSPTLLNQGNRLGVIFNGNYMKQNKLGHAHSTVVSIYIVYELKNRTVNNPDFTLLNGLFGAVKLTKDVNTSNYQYSGYGICFDSGGSFSVGNITNGRNVIIFGVDMSFSIHSTNKPQDIYLMVKDFFQGINGTTIYAEKTYKINFTEHSKKFVLSLHCNGDDSYLFVNGVEQLKFKSAINYRDRNLLYVGNISSD